MGKDVIIACDFASAEQTFAFLDKFTGKKPFVKIGMELYYAEGPAIVKQIKARGHKIFLDLKLHDIPNTVKKAMAVLSRLDVDICNLHAAGTTAMMQAARIAIMVPAAFFGSSAGFTSTGTAAAISRTSSASSIFSAFCTKRVSRVSSLIITT